MKALASADVQKRFADLGVEGRAMSPEEMRNFFAGEARRWSKVGKAARSRSSSKLRHE